MINEFIKTASKAEIQAMIDTAKKGGFGYSKAAELVKNNLVKENQLDQVVVARGSMQDSHASRREIMDVVARENPDHPMLHGPSRYIGETEMRFPLSDREYITRKHILSTRTSFGYDKVMSDNGLRLATAEEIVAAHERKNMQMLTRPEMHHFEVDENFYKLLEPIMKNIGQKEIRLPYEWTVFHLKYHVTEGSTKFPVVVVMHQHTETKEITVHPLIGDTHVHPTSQYIQEVYAVCVALDAEIIGKTSIAADLGRPTKKDSIARRTFKILRLKTSTKFIDNIHNVNTGRKATALHFRRGHWVHRKSKTFWRRSTIVGKIEYGVVEKVYSV